MYNSILAYRDIFSLANRPWWIIKPPTKDELTEAITLLQEKVSKTHITELNIIGTQGQAELTDTLGMVLQVAVETGCDSVTFWNALRCKAPPGGDVYEIPLGLFDCNYRPTKEYDLLLQKLQSLG